MMVLISAGDLITLYLGLELMSLALYVVAASHRDNAKSTEAGLKYFVLGALSSGMLLYGASLIYGFTGTVELRRHRRGRQRHGSIGLMFGLVFLLAGLCFKVSAVPFHMWTPDVYEGAPTPVTAFFASAPKVAAHGGVHARGLDRVPGIAPQWQQIVVFVAIASMALGSFAAIGQTNIKRLMAYSSIGHMGFALVGLAAGTAEGAQGVLVYIAIYVDDDARHLRGHPRDEAQRAGGREHLAISPVCRAPIRCWRSSSRCCCSRSPACRRSRASSRSSMCSSPRSRRAVHARRDRRARERGGRLLLSLHRQGDVFRRTGRRRSSRCASSCGGAGGRRPLQHPVRRLSRAAGVGRDAPPQSRCFDGIRARSAAAIAGYPARRVRRDRLDQCRGDGAARAPASAGRSGSSTDAADAGRGRRGAPGPRDRGNLAREPCSRPMRSVRRDRRELCFVAALARATMRSVRVAPSFGAGFEAQMAERCAAATAPRSSAFCSRLRRVGRPPRGRDRHRRQLRRIIRRARPIPATDR